MGYRFRQPLVFRAIMKYGWENIEHEILFENLTKSEAEQKEVELIRQYDSTNPGNGYNVESGGNVNKHLSEVTKEKLRQANIGKHQSEEAKKRLSKSLKLAYKEGRKTLTVEHRKKMESARKYEFTPWNKGVTHMSDGPVRQYTKDGEFVKEYPSRHAAIKETGIQQIYNASAGKRKTAGGYIWKMM